MELANFSIGLRVRSQANEGLRVENVCRLLDVIARIFRSAIAYRRSGEIF
jgi:hypothetical protein